MWLWQALSAVDVACARIGVACTCKGTARSVDTSSTGMGVTCTRASAVLQQTWYGRQGSGPAGAHLPDTRLLAVHHRHVAGLVVFDELLLGLIELLGHEAHEGVVWGVSYSPAAVGERWGYQTDIQAAAPASLDGLAQEFLLSVWAQHLWVDWPGLEAVTKLRAENLQGHLAPNLF